MKGMRRMRSAIGSRGAFFRASRAGDFQALLAVLDPEVVLRADETALRMGARNGWITSELHGARRGGRAVQRPGAGRAAGADRWCARCRMGRAAAYPRVAFAFTFRDAKVVEIELVADAERLSQMTIEILS